MDERTTVDCIANARALAPVIAAAAPRIEAGRELPPDLVDALHEARLFRMLVPRSLGGEEVSPVAFMQAIEEIAKADASTAWCIAQTSVCSTISKSMKPEIAEEIFKKNPRGVLAWGASTHTTPRRSRKTAAFASPASGRSPAAAATPPGLPRIAPIFEPDGQQRRDADGNPVQKTFVVPRERATISDVWHVIGLKGTGSDTYALTDVFVPEDYAIGYHALEPGRVARTRPALLIHDLSAVRIELSGDRARHRARDARRLSATLAQTKNGRCGQTSPLRDNAVVQSQVGVAQSQLAAARVFFFAAWEEIWQAAQSGTLSIDQRVRLRMASIHASQQARQVVETAYLAAGATAVFAKQSVRAPVPRHACGVAAGAVAILDLRGDRPAFPRPAAELAADLIGGSDALTCARRPRRRP